MATAEQHTNWEDMAKDIVTPIREGSTCYGAQLAIAHESGQILDANNLIAIRSFFLACNPGDTVAIIYTDHEEFGTAVSAAAKCLETNPDFNKVKLPAAS